MQRDQRTTFTKSVLPLPVKKQDKVAVFRGF